MLMNFARYGIINAKKFPDKEFLVEHNVQESEKGAYLERV